MILHRRNISAIWTAAIAPFEQSGPSLAYSMAHYDERYSRNTERTSRMRARTAGMIQLLAVALLALGCSSASKGEKGEDDGGTETESSLPDTGPDTAGTDTDTGTTPDTETATEDGSDTATEDGRDTATEAETETVSETETDTGTGTGDEPDTDTGYAFDQKLIVVNTADSGEGSLRDALTRADTIDETETVLIAFCIPSTDEGYDDTTGVWTIRLASALLPLGRGDIIVDGLTQGSCEGGGPATAPVVEVTTQSGAFVETGLHVTSAGNRIIGLSLGGFGHAIVLYDEEATDNRIDRCHLGVRADGATGLGNETGILIVEGASDNIVRDSVISANAIAGVHIGGKESTGNQIMTSRIGTNAAGTARLSNGVGVMIYKAQANRIGAPGLGNVISGNYDTGILITNKYAESNLILGNKIGTDITGTKLVYNDKGIVMKSLANSNVVGGAGTGEGNVISGNLEIGIYIEAADDNRIYGNMIGTDFTGTQAVVEGALVQGNGVEFNTVAKNNILGGNEPGEGNVVSGNKVYGVVYYGHCRENDTIGNMIGTDVTGELPLPNATGICFDCASHHNDVANNVISGNMSYGMFYVTRGTEYNTLRGNRIGTNADGTKAVPNDIGMVIATGASHNIVGGADPADRNIISGNTQSGVMITNGLTEHNVVEGNYIGVDASGQSPLPNKYGVMFSTYPQNNTLTNNVVSGNETAGVLLLEYSKHNTVTNNMIGVGPDAAGAVGNGAGVVVDWKAASNLVGTPDGGNVIAHNEQAGILVQQWSGTGNSFQGNVIFDNNALPIDIFPYGYNPNDAGDTDTGPNDLQNSPVIISAIRNGDALTIEGTLDTMSPETSTVEILAGTTNNGADVEDWLVLGTTSVNASGNWTLAVNDAGNVIVVMGAATDASGNTSEFCEHVLVTGGGK